MCIRDRFRIDRILKAPDILEESSVPVPEDFDINHYLNTMLRMYDGERKKVKLICDNDVVDSIIDKFGDDIEIRKNTKTTSIVTLDVVVSHVFFSWVFGFGGLVKIKTPTNIKKSFSEFIKTTYDIVSTCLLYTSNSVKTMPAYDPDAEVSSLIFTIPSWVNSINRVSQMPKLIEVSPTAKTRLKEELLKLQISINKIISAIKENSDGRLQ